MPRWNSSGSRSGSAPSASTRATTIVWSPPSYSFHREQSTQAPTPSRTGEPDGAAAQVTPANLSTPERANPALWCSWSAASTFTQNRPTSRMRGQVEDPRDGAKLTSGGSSDSDAKD
ncbi:hypothetical protein WY02_28050 [Pseudonocardia sp. AL041005-10]|nr:hypothetical protein WY02_28050 [Pseudonocardia sp. AL041005-10]